MTALPESIASGETGHLAHHEDIHDILNALHEDVTLHGAAGDGTTDDTAAIQSAIDAADPAGGGNATVYFPPGTYMVTAASGTTAPYALDVPADVTLLGAGRTAVTVQTDGAADPAVNNRIVRIAAGCTITRMTLDNNARNNAGTDPGGADGDGHCVDTTDGANDITLTRLRTYDARNYGINPFADWTASNSNDGWHIADVIADDCGWDGIDAKVFHNGVIDGFYAFNCGRVGIDIRADDGCRFSNLHAEGCGESGVAILASRTSGLLEATVENVLAVDNGTDSTAAHHGVWIFYDDAWATGDGFLTLSNVVARGNANRGVRHEIQAHNVHTTLTSVHAYNNGGSGIHMGNSRCVLTGCHMMNNGSWGFDNGGLDLPHLVVGNTAHGNTDGQVRGAGASALHANNLTS